MIHLEDLDTVGLRNDRIIVKSDQEPSIVDTTREVARQRVSDHGTALENREEQEGPASDGNRT